MKTIIAGSRNLTDYKLIQEAVTESEFDITRVVVGGARGIDQLAEEWARKNFVKFTVYYPNWNTEGKAAGYIRNEKMVDNADALIAIWDGESKGTAHMIDIARKYGLQVYVKRVVMADQPTRPIPPQMTGL
jgi:hypothetical protein